MLNAQRGQEKQLRLFEIDDDADSKAAANKNTSFSDPAFVGNKTLPVHRWVPWIAGFSSDFVKDVLSRYLKQKGTVLDPFSGVGTTLVEAVLQGHRAIGFEINPYAVLACRTKLAAYRVAPETLRNEITRFCQFCGEKNARSYVPTSTSPKGFRTRTDFYSPQVLQKVAMLQDFILTVENPILQDIFKLAFASTMVRYSNYSYEPSLTRRVSSGKEEILDFPVVQTIQSKLREMEYDISWLQEQLPDREAHTQIIHDSFFHYQQHLAPESVDLVITSPPYLNNYHYLRNTRPQLYWLGYAEQPQDLKYLEERNFGKYWQTVRDQQNVSFDFSLPNTDILERLQTLRQLHPEKGIYGGNGWANYAVAYLNDCYRFAEALNYLLKHDGTALVVIGNSILQGMMIPTDQYLARIAESVGLEVVSVDVLRSARVGSSIIQSSVRVGKAQDSHHLYEAVVELRKR